jgi:hypothetical protein
MKASELHVKAKEYFASMIILPLYVNGKLQTPSGPARRREEVRRSSGEAPVNVSKFILIDSD